LNDDVRGQKAGAQSLLEVSRPQSARISLPEVDRVDRLSPHTEADSNSARAPTPHTPSERGPVEPQAENEDQWSEQDGDRDHDHRGLLRRHPVASAAGLILLVLALASDYLYWD
jgi:hypothetical protein